MQAAQREQRYETGAVLYMAMELSNRQWKLGFSAGGEDPAADGAGSAPARIEGSPDSPLDHHTTRTPSQCGLPGQPPEENDAGSEAMPLGVQDPESFVQPSLSPEGNQTSKASPSSPGAEIWSTTPDAERGYAD